MGEAGLFDGERVELVRGHVFDLHTSEPRRLRIDEYDRLVARGMFVGEPMELILGELRLMTPVGIPHRNLVTQLHAFFVRALGEGPLEACSQMPLACAHDSEPEPDVSIVPFERRRTRHPSRAMLVIEVSDSSRRFDLGGKAAIYAQSDVAEYWVVDAAEQVVFVHRDRADGRWASIERVGRGATLVPAAVPGVALAVDALFAI